MSDHSSNLILDRILDPVMTRDVAQAIAAVQTPADVQARLDQLRAKANEGELTSAERDEYEQYVEGFDLVGILKAKARRVLTGRAS